MERSLCLGAGPVVTGVVVGLPGTGWPDGARIARSHGSLGRLDAHFADTPARSVNFVHDKLSNGRPYKMLTVLDEYTRQALAVEVRTRMTAGDVLEILFGLFLRHGKPEHLRSDNGPEFTPEAFQTWLQRVGGEPIGIFPGSPWENGYNERFNGTLRREVLNAEWFATTRQAQIVINSWLRQYNHTRPHQALNMRPPVPETLRRNGPETGG